MTPQIPYRGLAGRVQTSPKVPKYSCGSGRELSSNIPTPRLDGGVVMPRKIHRWMIHATVLLSATAACQQKKETALDTESLKATKLTPLGPANVYLFAYSPITKIRPVGEDLCWYYAEVPQWGKKTTLEQALARATSLNSHSLYTKKIYDKYKADILLNLGEMASSTSSGAAACSASATGVGAVLVGVGCVISGVTLITSAMTVNNSRSALAITDKGDIRRKMLSVEAGGIDALKDAVQSLKPDWNLDRQDRCFSADVVIKEAKSAAKFFPVQVSLKFYLC